ncbi:MAG: class I SAM-dependent methyltransferase [Anaerolineaceae bacterium]|nr:MAG: class I SAM-dependent methyltransferase [Anaerolineaceae bacterium]
MTGFYHTIARFYDAENKGKDDDIALYIELAEQYQPNAIMDIGCGTGRVMLPLAERGHTVHGIDNEPAMLQRAEAYRDASPDLRGRVILHQGDVRTYTLDQRFDMILVPYNGLMHFHEQAEQIAVIQRLRQWITADGLLVLDLPNAGEIFATPETDALILDRTFLEPESGHLVMQMSHSQLDRVTQLLRVQWIYDEITADGAVVRTTAPLVLHYYFQSELRLLLERGGFAVEAVYGDTEYNPFEDGSERMIVFARPA